MANTDERIQKVLSENGVMSRRKAEELIAQGKIKVNGHPAKLGDKINPKRDVVTIGDERVYLQAKQKKIYIMLNKPRGYVTTLEDELGRRCVAELVEDAPGRVYPIGRLDKNSEGLLLFTNDGEFANLLMHPRYHVSKVYRVTVRPGITDDQLVTLSSGMEIDGEKLAPAVIRVVTQEQGRVVMEMTLHEGKNRQIRRMCEAVGLEVARLKRISVGPVRLGMLKTGVWRELTKEEVAALRHVAEKEKKSKFQGKEF